MAVSKEKSEDKKVKQFSISKVEALELENIELKIAPIQAKINEFQQLITPLYTEKKKVLDAIIKRLGISAEDRKTARINTTQKKLFVTVEEKKPVKKPIVKKKIVKKRR